MSDFAKFGHDELIFFPPGQVVRYHIDGNGPYDPVLTVRTMRTRVEVQLPNGRRQAIPNLLLSHYTDAKQRDHDAAECGWVTAAGTPTEPRG